MNAKTHGMRFIFLLAVTALWVVTPFTPALAGGMGGTRADGCDDFRIADKPIFEGGKALSADIVEYNFSVKMRLGFDVSKEESNCKARPCTAKVAGNWNSKTGQASERFDITCTYGKDWYEPYPSSLTLTTLVTCPKDPWINSEGMLKNSVSCSAPSFTGTGRFSPAMPIYPLTATLIGYEGRERIAAVAISWGTGDFALPPLNRPGILVNGAGCDTTTISRKEDAKITLLRPSDGSPQWYKNPWKYDVEIEVKSGGKFAIADGWVKKINLPAVPGAEKSDVILSYTQFFNDDEANWNIEKIGMGNYRMVRIRARVQHATAPWSNWCRFWVEPPLSAIKAPGIGKAPAAVGGTAAPLVKAPGTGNAPSAVSGTAAPLIKAPAAGKQLPVPATRQQMK